ncbi:hypothetical protein GV794_24595 [Nocardia cyriacigeorgica]|uniref:ESX-1 secretion-associated protein n=1 Tax=Nocardia cyriacigeorgica TaxID=135487 RepID=A0A6P1DA66_9NOCA|nr:hypothetical protein [Nocardia cyriacigeorgica]NEW38659.1 hypothetical protein [Nocardia cyriacigeorgica]NEW46519.1 hypothetical protein [Nocardia cyriacigeorgica]NEW53433.1 hypothetical protein [Nocardia cyriacigeorgica]NEW58793.1 hypothetical protein [Nocardia cyriacigeorgica]
MARTVRIDPDAVSTYKVVADQVAGELAGAAAQLVPGTDAARIAAGVGLLGADFATEFVAAVGDDYTALSTAATLVTAYGQTVQGQAAAAGGLDADGAAALGRAGEQA